MITLTKSDHAHETESTHHVHPPISPPPPPYPHNNNKRNSIEIEIERGRKEGRNENTYTFILRCSEKSIRRYGLLFTLQNQKEKKKNSYLLIVEYTIKFFRKSWFEIYSKYILRYFVFFFFCSIYLQLWISQFNRMSLYWERARTAMLQVCLPFTKDKESYMCALEEIHYLHIM